MSFALRTPYLLFYFLVSFLFLLPFGANRLLAQNLDCGFDLLQSKARLNTQQLIAEEQTNASIRNTLINNQFQPESSIVYTVPVVFHIIHKPSDLTPGDPTNPTDAAIVAGLDLLNLAMRNSGIFDSLQGVDVEIQFCLAKQNPQGHYTTGITRTPGQTTINLGFFQTIQSSIAWNTTQYLEIYLVEGIISGPVSLSGFASFPSSHGNSADGVGIVYSALNFPDITVLVHEIGHYLGLYHTFEGGCNNNDCQLDGDLVCDTPPDSSYTYAVSCNASVNSCHTDTADFSLNNPFRPISMGGLGDQDDPIHNYMDFQSYICQNQFTQGQKDRMRAALSNVRSSLLTSDGCVQVCSLPPASFFVLGTDTINAGDTLPLIYAGQNATWFEWQIDSTFFTNATDTIVSFNTPGWHQITLSVANDSILCDTLSFTRDVFVVCNAVSSFSPLPIEINVGSSLSLNATSPNATTLEWLDGILPIGNQANFNYNFYESGIFEISLISNDGTCQDTARQLVHVGHCKKYLEENWVLKSGQGINFSSGSAQDMPAPSPNSIGWLNAAVSDAQHNLLIYTNGHQVLNRFGQIILNGDSLGTQQFTGIKPALICPYPGDTNRYFVFTSSNIAAEGLRFALVDVQADSGRGAVIQKRVLLANGNFPNIALARHANGSDFWLLARDGNGNQFQTFPISQNGIGQAFPQVLGIGNGGAGEIQISPSGKMLAVSKLIEIELYDFDPATGLASNLKTIQPTYPFCYAIEFSGDSRLLYASLSNNNAPYPIAQYDLSQPNGAAISSSEDLLFVANFGSGRMAIGPDGIVYFVDGASAVKQIRSPNRQGIACDPESNGLFPTPFTGLFQLCETPPSFVNRQILPLLGPDEVCANSQATFTLTESDSTIWDYRGNGSIDSLGVGLVRIDFGNSGPDTLIVWSRLACQQDLSDTIVIQVNGLASFPLLAADTTLCLGDSIILSPNGNFQVVVWQDTLFQNQIWASNSGNYWVAVEDSNACTYFDTISVQFRVSPQFSLGADTTLCLGNSLQMNAPMGFSSYIWQDGSQGMSITALDSGIFWLEVTDTCGNTFRDSLLIFADSPRNLNLGPDTLLCPAQSLLLQAPSGFSSYVWQDGSTQNAFLSTNQGTYWVQATNSFGCSYRDTIVVDYCLGNALEMNVWEANVYPNPNEGRFHIRFGGCEVGETIVVELFNILGQSLLKEKTVAKLSAFDLPFDGSTFSRGIYWLRISNATHQFFLKVEFQ